jgi:hypothetical protein
VPAVENDVWNWELSLFSATGVPELVPSTLNCTVPDGSDVEPIAVTVAVKVSMLPFEGVFELAVKAVDVEYWVGDEVAEPPPPPLPQLATPIKIDPDAQIARSRFFRLLSGTVTNTRNAAEMPLRPVIHGMCLGWFDATGPALTDCACVVVTVREELPEPDTELGENTQAAPVGSPEHEKFTVPENPFW